MEKERVQGKSNKEQKRNKNSKSTVKISSNYKSLEPCKVDIMQFNLTKLTYGIIESTDLKYVIANGEKIDINGDWKMLILILLNAVVEEYKSYDKISKVLMENSVTSKTFVVSNMYGIYNFDKNKQYKVYKLFDKDIYIESLFTTEDIFKAIIGLTKICGYSLDEFSLCIKSHRYNEKLLDFSILDDNEHILEIDNIALAEKANWQLVEVEVFGERVQVHDINAVPWILCNGIVIKYGKGELEKMPRGKYVGISKTTDNKDRQYMQIMDSDKYIYTSIDRLKTIEYLKKSIERIGIAKGEIKFKYRERKRQ